MDISYTVLRTRRKTIALQILPDGTLLVRCPSRMKDRDIQRFVESKSHWIYRHLPKAAPLPRFTEVEKEQIRQTAKDIICDRVEFYAKKMGVCYHRLTLRFQRTRWGSCSSKGNLNFNCLLVHIPTEVMDYVVVHELCHLTHMDHSPEFWRAVEAILPNYQTHRAWLKEHGNSLLARL